MALSFVGVATSRATVCLQSVGYNNRTPAIGAGAIGADEHLIGGCRRLARSYLAMRITDAIPLGSLRQTGCYYEFLVILIVGNHRCNDRIDCYAREFGPTSFFRANRAQQTHLQNWTGVLRVSRYQHHGDRSV